MRSTEIARSCVVEQYEEQFHAWVFSISSAKFLKLTTQPKCYHSAVQFNIHNTYMFSAKASRVLGEKKWGLVQACIFMLFCAFVAFFQAKKIGSVCFCVKWSPVTCHEALKKMFTRSDWSLSYKNSRFTVKCRSRPCRKREQNFPFYGAWTKTAQLSRKNRCYCKFKGKKQFFTGQGLESPPRTLALV